MNNYEEDFPFYLKFTDEKHILSQEILKLFKKFKVKSVLDIGAGNGDLSKLLFNEVERYTAVEPRREFTESLKKKGINVIENSFPCYVGKEKYNFVLCSHSVPSVKREYEPFLKEAFEKLDSKGNLQLITYIGKENDWDMLLEEINVKPFDDTSIKYLERKDFLKQLGRLEEWFVFSRVKSSSIDNLIRALSFVASGGEEEKRDTFLSKSKDIRKILITKYFDKESAMYFFPFKHVFLRANKE
jgi:ubiquinone/menaquinone biosynthesis C-methylase UbiE